METMSEKHLDPARSIIAHMGGIAKVCEITGRHISNVYRWMAPREKRGTGGKVPYEEADKLLAWASENGVDLRGDDFFDASRLQEMASNSEEEACV